MATAPAARAATFCTGLGTTVTCTYTYQGSEQTFLVPGGVTSVSVTATGASGGNTGSNLIPGTGGISSGGGGGGGLYGGGGGGGASYGDPASSTDTGSGGGGGGSSLGTTTGAATAAGNGSVTITYTALLPHATLRVYLKHRGVFRPHHTGRFMIRVRNRGTIRVLLGLPGQLVVTGNHGRFWNCRKQAHSSLCIRSAPVRAHRAVTIIVTVRVNARRGTTLFATASVKPPDNFYTDRILVR